MSIFQYIIMMSISNGSFHFTTLCHICVTCFGKIITLILIKRQFIPLSSLSCNRINHFMFWCKHHLDVLFLYFSSTEFKLITILRFLEWLMYLRNKHNQNCFSQKFDKKDLRSNTIDYLKNFMTTDFIYVYVHMNSHKQ